MTSRLLDISRLISRIGRGPLTGIDRVELAYMSEFLGRDEPAFFLCRLPKSYAVLDQVAGQRIFDRISGNQDWGKRGWARWFSIRSNATHQKAIRDVWHAAVFRCSPRRLRARLGALFPSGVSYFNVGHSNLRKVVFDAVQSLPISKIIVLIHDIIPLTSPEFSTPENTKRFGSDLRRVAKRADLVIYNSQETQRVAEALFAGWGKVPEGIAAHLGSDMSQIGQVFDAASEKPSFVILGTIEPRKNHELLLSIWQGFVRDLDPKDVPTLHIVGRRGWNNDRIFNILDRDPMMNTHVFEHLDMPDSDVQKLLAQSWALLFPSLAEGFGLPLIEAARSGVPIICGENAIYREILGDYPLYLNVDNSYLWSQRILGRAGRKRESEAERQMRGGTVKIPTWDAHFDRIFRFV